VAVELGPIVRAMRTNRVKVALLMVEIAVTMAIVLNCLAMIGEQKARIETPTGIDETHIIAVRAQPWGREFDDHRFQGSVIERDLAAFRALPGVIDAAAISNFPLQGGGSSFQVKPLGAPDSAKLRSPVYSSDAHFLKALGLDLIAGRNFDDSDVPQTRGPRLATIIVTKDLADALYPDGDALGKAVDTGSEKYPDTIIGIVKQMHTPYGGGPMEDRITFYAANPELGAAMRYVIRTKPGELAAVMGQVEGTMEAINPERIVTVRTLEEVKGNGYLQNRFVAAVLTVVMGLLLVVTVMGIFGMTSASVTQRTRQIGTRRALGGTRADIVTYFLVEISVIAAAGMLAGVGGAVALNLALVHAVGIKPFGPGLVVAGVALLWVIALAAALLPARRAAAIPPAVATRTV
jgi:putative ABC transport system permease protein